MAAVNHIKGLLETKKHHIMMGLSFILKDVDQNLSPVNMLI